MTGKAIIHDNKANRYIFAALLSAIFAVLFGPAVYAQFTRTTGPGGVGYGYGYGYGYGFGTNGFTSYRVTGGDDDMYLYGYGLGRRASSGGGGGGSSSEPTAQVYSPNGGETLAAGNSYNVVWALGGTNVAGARLSYSTNDGSTWTQIATDLTENSYSWTVPNINTNLGKIRVEALATGGGVAATDVSNYAFTIIGDSDADTDDGSGSGTDTPTTTTTSTVEGSNDDGGVTSNSDMSRTEVNEDLPEGFTVDTIVKLPNDGNEATDADTTVYYIGMDGKRHPFPSRQIYDSWYSGFDMVKPIDNATLSSIPLGAPIMSRPGSYWVKIVSDPKTYYVAPGNKLRWIKDEAAANLLGGANWNTRIIDIDPSLFSLFTAGADIDVAYLENSWPAGSLVKSDATDSQTFYVTADGRRNFTGADAMDANMFQSRFVNTTAPTAGWSKKSVKTNISGFEDGLFSLMH